MSQLGLGASVCVWFSTAWLQVWENAGLGGVLGNCCGPLGTPLVWVSAQSRCQPQLSLGATGNPANPLISSGLSLHTWQGGDFWVSFSV